jgi:hypothetical protein
MSMSTPHLQFLGCRGSYLAFLGFLASRFGLSRPIGAPLDVVSLISDELYL